MDRSTSPGTAITFMIICGVFAWFYVSKRRAERATEAELQDLGPVRARIGSTIALLANPWRLSLVQDGQRQTWPLTADTEVTVDVEGEISTARGRNLASKAVGGAATLGIGLFFFGNAKNRTVDHRELYITITSRDDARVVTAPPTLNLEARRFAASVNVIAQQLAETV
jgi:hypothetical protein